MRPVLPVITMAVLALSHAAPALATQPLHQTVEQAYPQLDYFFQELVKERDGITIDGRAPFQSHDKFLPGKIATGLADVLLHTPADDPRLPGMLRDYASIADLTVGMENDTWGIYYYIGALYKLKQAGLLERAVRPATLDQLRKKLDWRTFVRVPAYELIDLPTNYYGVAFSIARLRLLMGWEDAQASDVLLDRMLKHYADYSGTYGFSDETDGQGRFDRYSILLAAEICERFIETGLTVTPELKALLRKSADVALNAANADGSGFTMGRSLGPYGETAMLEILSTAAYLGVLTPEEKEYAYAYSARIGERYMTFWYDPALHSVDMWGKGRRTDTYRGKHRILGENFSLLHQLISTDEMWNRAGMKNAVPRADLAAWLERARPAFSLTRFAGGEYDRALAIWRDGPHVFSLSMINGGPSQHANSPYYPLPFSYGIVSGIADSGAAHPQLLPKFRLADGSELIATAFLKNIRTSDIDGGHRVTYRQDALTKLGKNVPVKDTRIAVETEYTLRHGVITRTDTYTPAAPLDVAGVSLDFASFSSGATVDGNTIAFRDGAVRTFAVDGLASCSAADVTGSEAYRAPYGPMATLATCRTGAFTFDKPLRIRWTIRYQ
ncbi:hypothetical protein ASD28_18255 [Massilia sp. Root133]|uniref:Uncharacterized protein n=1 Tax=Massilia cellulosiltytica TaxID=2683234 RepID=A0A7X3G4P0_9BURK|nr:MULTISPECIES: hypothetical protein [Telluria group]KQX97012.1 hypothetical protein ASD28_18255 [Massilia sp. Root133]KQZ52718.1 hypothetical protein ASD92_19675 [Massilia sp. Root1485]MVW63385.1 hypothetical protein [Telluria cellulosilytica]